MPIPDTSLEPLLCTPVSARIRAAPRTAPMRRLSEFLSQVLVLEAASFGPHYLVIAPARAMRPGAVGRTTGTIPCHPPNNPATPCPTTSV
ncbi:MAG: hypothetical protein GY698_19900 [Actinomycetia bacterium]|nr:hypothetical protein [Actinomycetes bacterium]